MLGFERTPSQRARLVWHSLRHTFGTRIVRETDIETARDLLGHADIATTAKYLHTDRKRKQEAVARLGAR